MSEEGLTKGKRRGYAGKTKKKGIIWKNESHLMVTQDNMFA
jgi:hypothetical protein